MDNVYESLRHIFIQYGLPGIEYTAYYFIAVNSFYMLLLVLALLSVKKRKNLKPFTGQMDHLSFSPAITILAPAFNEERSIEESTKALLHLQYTRYEVMVLNDGSKDGTLEILKEKFSLYQENLPRWSQLGKGVVRGTYKSKIFPNLTVIDKFNSGKADSLNVGIDYASKELICCVDSDSLLEQDALIAVTAPFLEDPTTIASGGTIRVINSNKLENSSVTERRFPSEFLPAIQLLEYIRAFFCGRVGWNSLNATIIISGAFGAFKKDAVVTVGGYQTDTLGEDMDLVVRLHAYHRLKKIPYQIVFLPEPVCWTEVPSDWGTLKKQRRRWSIGLAQVLWKYKGLLMNPRYGTVGLIAFPYFLFVDLLSPFIEFFAIFLIVAGVFFGYFGQYAEVLLFFISIFYGSIVTYAAAMIDDSFDENRRHFPSLRRIFLFSILENFGYRQIHALWRIEGVLKAFKKDHRWGSMKRKGLTNGG
ncbi:glycosyltransferase family 2 protein [Bdellovibrio bacteriovorus]